MANRQGNRMWLSSLVIKRVSLGLSFALVWSLGIISPLHAQNDPISLDLAGDPVSLDSQVAGDWTVCLPQGGGIYGDCRQVPVPGNITRASLEGRDIDHVLLRKDFRITGAVPADLALRLGKISDRDRAFVNGVAIGASGDWDAESPQAYDKIRLYPVPDGLIRADAVNTLTIQAQKYFIDDLGINQDTTRLGRRAVLTRDYYNVEYFQVILLMAYATAGAYFLFLYIRRTREREYLLFAIFTFLLVIYQFLRTQIKYELGWELHFTKRVEYLMLVWMLPVIYSFFDLFFKADLPWTWYLRCRLALRRIRRAENRAGMGGRELTALILRLTRDAGYLGLFVLSVLIGLAAFVLVLVSPDTRLWDAFNISFVQPSWLFWIFALVYVLVRNLRRHDRDALYFSAGMAVMFACMVLDILSTRQVLVLPRLAGYGFIIFVMSIAAILANRFVRLNNQFEELNATLEAKVRERTQQLQNSLTQIQALKVQQDGDYFLTSLLVKPLSQNQISSTRTSVKYLIRQKKQFQFKNRQSEIGGDLCAAFSIRLRGRDYAVFINGDAMGKSIQGAGGALVLGTVFNSYVSRTRSDAALHGKFPEIWLRDLFLDLQNIFTSFDGSMLISVALGLLDEAAGCLYYINAEHPWSVLYRRGRAEFIENELSLRKIGIPEIENHFRVRLFALQPGDVLLLGSDGRDDLMVERDGKQQINEDETEFLRRVTESEANLEALEHGLRQFGALTDDLSILRVGFREQERGVATTAPSDGWQQEWVRGRDMVLKGQVGAGLDLLRRLDQEHPHSELRREILKARLKIKEYAAGENDGLLWSEAMPADGELIYLTALCAKMNRHYGLAEEISMRLYWRDPSHVPNLINLADINRVNRNSSQALAYIAKARDLDPQNPTVEKIAEMLASGGETSRQLT